jgi:hypothetical protein
MKDHTHKWMLTPKWFCKLLRQKNGENINDFDEYVNWERILFKLYEKQTESKQTIFLDIIVPYMPIIVVL